MIKQSIRRRIVAIAAGLIILMVATSVLSMIMVGRVGHLLDELTDTAKQSGLVYEADPLPEAGHFFRSDHFSFAKRGVPAISFGSGNDWVDGGMAAGKAAEAEYTTNHYHQPSDEVDPAWSS